MAVSHVLSATTPDDPSYEIRPSHWNSVHNQYLTISGNTAGQSTFSGTNLVFEGGPNATLSINGNTLVWSGGAGAAGNTGYISGGTTHASLGTVLFNNANGVSFGVDGQTVTASHNGLTSQSNQAVSAANGSYAFQTLSFSNANGISFGTSAGSAITGSHNALTSQSNQAFSADGGSSAFQTLNFRNANGLSFSNSGGSVQASYTVPTVPAQLSVGNSNLGNTAGDTGVFTGRVVFVGSDNITLSGSSNAGSATVSIIGAAGGGGLTNIRVSAGTTSNLLSAVTFADANGISFGLDASTVTASHNALTSQSNQNVTAGNGGFAFQTLSFSNVNGISFGTSAGSAITASHNALTSQSNQAFSADASSTFQTLSFQNSNGVSFSNNAGAIRVTHDLAGTSTGFAGANISGSMTHNSAGLNLSLSVAAPGAAAENNNINLLGANTAGNTTASGSTIGWSGINLTLSGTNNSVVNISAPATSSIVGTSGISVSTNGATISVQPVTINGWEPYRNEEVIMGQAGQASLILDPMRLENCVQFDRVLCPIHNTNATNSSGSHTISFWVGLFTQNVSTLSRYWSASASTAVTHSGTVGSYSLYSGMRNFSFGATTTLSEGKYWLGYITRTTSGGANGSYSQYIKSQLNTAFTGMFGVAVNTTMQYTLGQGAYTATTSGIPGSIAFSEIRGSDSVARRPPIILFQSGTA